MQPVFWTVCRFCSSITLSGEKRGLTADDALIKADHRVSVLFEVEQGPSDQRVLRIRGRANVRTDKQAQRSYNLQTARKYLLTSGGIRNALIPIRRLLPMYNYHVQAAEKGQPCVIEVTPEQAEFLNNEKLG